MTVLPTRQRSGATADPSGAGPQRQGLPAGAGFVRDADEAQALLARSEAEYAAVVRPDLFAAAYGWPKHVAYDPQESNQLLLELNRAIAAGEVEHHPFD